MTEQESRDVIARATTGEGEPGKYGSVPEMLADLARKRVAELEAEVERLRAAGAEEREACAKVAEHIWDTGQEGAHGGEQAIRTAAAIRARSDRPEG